MSPGHPLVGRAGLVAALLGTAAGTAEVLVGTAPWLGDKNDPTTLGLVTVLLALVVGAAALGWRRAVTTPRALAVAAAMLVPALLGLTTAGAAWVPAAAAAVVGGAAALHHGVRPSSLRPSLRAQWPSILLGSLALVYVALGIASRGLPGVLALVGALAVGGTLVLRHRSPALAAAVLVAGTVPWAVLDWWSIVPPATTVLALAVGLPLVLRRPAAPPGPAVAGRRLVAP